VVLGLLVYGLVLAFGLVSLGVVRASSLADCQTYRLESPDTRDHVAVIGTVVRASSGDDFLYLDLLSGDSIGLDAFLGEHYAFTAPDFFTVRPSLSQLSEYRYEVCQPAQQQRVYLPLIWR
jgi:hypothetical protein